MQLNFCFQRTNQVRPVRLHHQQGLLFKCIRFDLFLTLWRTVPLLLEVQWNSAEPWDESWLNIWTHLDETFQFDLNQSQRCKTSPRTRSRSGSNWTTLRDERQQTFWGISVQLQGITNRNRELMEHEVINWNMVWTYRPYYYHNHISPCCVYCLHLPRHKLFPETICVNLYLYINKLICCSILMNDSNLDRRKIQTAILLSDLVRINNRQRNTFQESNIPISSCNNLVNFQF